MNFHVHFIDTTHPCIAKNFDENEKCCNHTAGMKLHSIMKVMKFASNRGRSHYNKEMFLQEDEQHANEHMKYKLIPKPSLKPKDAKNTHPC